MARGDADRRDPGLLRGPQRPLPNQDQAPTSRRATDAPGPRREWRTRAGQELHRDGGPAVEYDDGSWEWRRHGLLHRDDGPAVYLSAGREEWSVDDGLAWGHADETELWFRDGRLHREDGPAAVERGTWSAVTSGEHYYRDGKLDRSDGPAFYREYSDEPALEMWFRAGTLHRKDGPAQRFADGREAWLLDGQLHREDGPAVVVPDDVRGEFALDELAEAIPAGSELYYLDGERLSPDEWRQRVAGRHPIKPRLA